jgi:hypothetical protein
LGWVDDIDHDDAGHQLKKIGNYPQENAKNFSGRSFCNKSSRNWLHLDRFALYRAGQSWRLRKGGRIDGTTRHLPLQPWRLLAATRAASSNMMAVDRLCRVGTFQFDLGPEQLPNSKRNFRCYAL